MYNLSKCGMILWIRLLGGGVRFVYFLCILEEKERKPALEDDDACLPAEHQKMPVDGVKVTHLSRDL